ncbi:hypothetical protein Tco_0277744 [Tanacetum coccineum]
MSIVGLREKHEQELENLTLFLQPFKTLKLFIVAVAQYLRRSLVYLLTHGVWLMLFIVVTVVGAVLFLSADGPHATHVEELLEYARFGLWWVALGVASSIGLGSGLHTFVLYLGPHIAFFTIKAMQCGRVDIKTAIYDTIQLNRSPSWLKKDCSEFGPSLFSSEHGIQVPLTSILPQVQVEAILWGLGTALGELPPYFISRAGEKIDAAEELDASSSENNGVASNLNHMKRWLLSHAQYLNFFTILVLASVPNPLFDLAGIMCGQFGIPFWEFFFATLIGKAIVKTHIQTVFIISVCNNQLLDWIENELIWMLSFIPGVASALPTIVAKLHAMKEKYMTAPLPVTSNIKVKSWDLSFASVWNSIVWLMLLNFFVKIVNSTAQRIGILVLVAKLNYCYRIYAYDSYGYYTSLVFCVLSQLVEWVNDDDNDTLPINKIFLLLSNNITIQEKSVGIVDNSGYRSNVTFGFGVCPITCDPTLVKVSKVKNGDITRWPVEIYTLSSKTWKTIPCSNLSRELFIIGMSQVDIDRFIYWVARSKFVGSDGVSLYKNLVMSFNLITKEFKEVCLPDSLAKPTTFSICKLRESLVSGYHFEVDGVREEVYGVWMMEEEEEERGVMTYFKKLFTIKTPDSRIRLRGFRKSGEPIMETEIKGEKYAAIKVHEPCSDHINDLGIYGKRYSFFVSPYTETLLLSDHMDCCIYSDGYQGRR